MAAPLKTVAIVCGASGWPALEQFESARAFENTASSARTYLTSPKGLGLTEENLLWLFDSDDSAASQLDAIYAFITARLEALKAATNGANVFVLFFYIGHGAFFGTEQVYCLLLRDTHNPSKRQTSMPVAELASVLKLSAPESARIVILDCCFAGVAFKDFQSDIDSIAGKKIDEALEISQSETGVALLCAASAKNPAKLKGTDSYTLFGEALFQTLAVGDTRSGRSMSLRQVCTLMRNVLANTPDAPNPEVHAPNQKPRDLSEFPLFPNQAYRSKGEKSIRRRRGRPTIEDSPAAGLALGYYLNWVKRIAQALFDPTAKARLLDETGELSIPQIERFNIYIPRDLDLATASYLSEFMEEMKAQKCEITAAGRPLSTYFVVQDHSLRDFPTTLTTIREAVRAHFPYDPGLRSDDARFVLEGEIDRFVSVLKRLKRNELDGPPEMRQFLNERVAFYDLIKDNGKVTIRAHPDNPNSPDAT